LHELVGTHGRTLSQLYFWAKASPGGTPLNFLAQKFALDMFGFSSLTARLPSVFFGAASLWMFVRIARETFDIPPGNGRRVPVLLAGAIFAFLPQIFRYGVEARPYSQALFFVLLAYWFWLRLEEAPTRKDTIGFALATAAGLYTQALSLYIPLGLAAWSLRNPRSRKPVVASIVAVLVSYIPWFIAQRSTYAITHTMYTIHFSWDQITPHGFVRELAGGGYFASVPLLVLAAFGKDARLAWISLVGLAAPVAGDATVGYFFAGRQLIFALPFLILLAVKGAMGMPRQAAAGLLIPLFAASAVIDFRQATKSREDWETPARYLASRGGPCVFIWQDDQLRYLRVYEPRLIQCNPASLPPEFLYVTTRYSPPAEPPKGYERIKTEQIGVTDIALYRRDASLKTYGLSRFVLRP
jgi:4-amino-4-deoxy-L-arabinose transferase-like glycosyltransferase